MYNEADDDLAPSAASLTREVRAECKSVVAEFKEAPCSSKTKYRFLHETPEQQHSASVKLCPLQCLLLAAQLAGRRALVNGLVCGFDGKFAGRSVADGYGWLLRSLNVNLVAKKS